MRFESEVNVKDVHDFAEIFSFKGTKMDGGRIFHLQTPTASEALSLQSSHKLAKTTTLRLLINL